MSTPANPEPRPATPAALTVDIVGAARHLGVSRSKMIELLMAGQVRSFTVGRRRLVPIAEIERFVTDRTEASR